MKKAEIFDIYRGTTHDGPGLRSTVFFSGCPLACAWCHNPEGISPTPRVWWDRRACIGCGLCHEACPTGANQPNQEGIEVNTALCSACGQCVSACPTKAMAFVAKGWTPEELLDEVLRDKPYYLRTGGGVTASGGECMGQYAFVAQLFSALHAHGVNTALDTSGFAPWQAFEQVLPHTDYVLYDLKLWDEAQHRQFTGQGNKLILENVRLLAQSIAESRCRAELWVRTPLIPGATATQENLAALGRFIAQQLRGTVRRWELCAFNNSCTGKYQRLNAAWPYQNTPLLTKQQAQALRAAALSAGLPEECVVVTGLLAD